MLRAKGGGTRAREAAREAPDARPHVRESDREPRDRDGERGGGGRAQEAGGQALSARVLRVHRPDAARRGRRRDHLARTEEGAHSRVERNPSLESNSLID